MPENQWCKNCLFFKETAADKGECRRYPPLTPIPNGNPGWPVCNAKDWCGEWKKEPT